jgi:hypothetical protein
MRGTGSGGAGGSRDARWSELDALVEHLEEEASRVEGRQPRPTLEVWGEIERLEEGRPYPEPAPAGRATAGRASAG